MRRDPRWDSAELRVAVGPAAHTQFVVAIIPSWVVRSQRQVIDAHYIAYALAQPPAGARYRPVAASIDWLTGVEDALAPMTLRELEATECAATAEMMLAQAVVCGDRGLPDYLWAKLGLTPEEPWRFDTLWSEMVALTLRWLLEDEQNRPPIELPRRLSDGSTPTADQLYAEAEAAAPRCNSWGLEERHEARLKAEQAAARYRELDRLAR
jgi:hypothetical protein